MRVLERRQFIPLPTGAVWEFFATPANLDAMTPRSMRFEIVSGGEGRMFRGQRIEYRIEVFPLCRMSWVSEIEECVEGERFVDVQKRGPYKLWHHLHRFEPVAGGTLMTDIVRYDLPLGLLGGLAHGVFVRRRLEQIFDYRSRFLEERFGADPAVRAR